MLSIPSLPANMGLVRTDYHNKLSASIVAPADTDAQLCEAMVRHPMNGYSPAATAAASADAEVEAPHSAGGPRMMADAQGMRFLDQTHREICQQSEPTAAWLPFDAPALRLQPQPAPLLLPPAPPRLNAAAIVAELSRHAVVSFARSHAALGPKPAVRQEWWSLAWKPSHLKDVHGQEAAMAALLPWLQDPPSGSNSSTSTTTHECRVRWSVLEGPPGSGKRVTARACVQAAGLQLVAECRVAALSSSWLPGQLREWLSQYTHGGGGGGRDSGQPHQPILPRALLLLGIDELGPATLDELVTELQAGQHERVASGHRGLVVLVTCREMHSRLMRSVAAAVTSSRVQPSFPPPLSSASSASSASAPASVLHVRLRAPPAVPAFALVKDWLKRRGREQWQAGLNWYQWAAESQGDLRQLVLGLQWLLIQAGQDRHALGRLLGRWNAVDTGASYNVFRALGHMFQLPASVKASWPARRDLCHTDTRLPWLIHHNAWKWLQWLPLTAPALFVAGWVNVQECLRSMDVIHSQLQQRFFFRRSATYLHPLYHWLETWLATACTTAASVAPAPEKTSSASAATTAATATRRPRVGTATAATAADALEPAFRYSSWMQEQKKFRDCETEWLTWLDRESCDWQDVLGGGWDVVDTTTDTVSGVSASASAKCVLPRAVTDRLQACCSSIGSRE